MPWEKVQEVIEEDYGEPVSEHFAEFEHEAFAAASIGQVHRATLLDGREVAVKIQYPGVAEALEADLRNAGHDRAAGEGDRARASTPRPSPRSCASGCWRSSTTSTRRRTSAASRAPTATTRSSTCPTSITRLSRRRVLVTEFVEGMQFDEIKQLVDEERSRFGEIVFRFCFGSIYHLQHFNADAHPATTSSWTTARSPSSTSG